MQSFFAYSLNANELSIFRS